MGKILKRNDLAARWGISLSTLEKRPDSLMPARLKLPGSRLWMTREEDLLDFEAHCVVRPEPSNDDNKQPQAQESACSQNKQSQTIRFKLRR